MAAQSKIESDTNATSNRRRKHIVNAGFQWKWFASIVVLVFGISALMTVATYGVIYQSVRASLVYGGGHMLGSTTLSLVLCALGFAVVPAAALGFWSIFVTHRICGPLYAMERDLGEVAKGRFPEQRPLRKKDHFKQFHAAFWNALSELRRKDDSYRDALAEVYRLAASAGTPDDVLAKIAAKAAPFVDDPGNGPIGSGESESKPSSKAPKERAPFAESSC